MDASQLIYSWARGSYSRDLNHAVPYGTDFAEPVFRHFIPGYYHSVPPGPIPTRPEWANPSGTVHKIASTRVGFLHQTLVLFLSDLDAANIVGTKSTDG